MNILWIKTDLLHPVNSGGRIRTYAMLRELHRTHQVTFLCMESEDNSEARTSAAEYCSRLRTLRVSQAHRGSLAYLADVAKSLVLSSMPYALWRYRNRAFARLIEQSIAEERPDVVVCDFLAPASNVKRVAAERLILFQHNVESSIWRRHEAVHRTSASRWFWSTQRRRMERWERHLAEAFDHVIAVSDADRAAFTDEFGLQSVSAVPTGVDTTYFTPRESSERIPNRIVFTGAMDWMPNIDGIHWFVSECLPKIHQSVPDVELLIVGRNPDSSIQALHRPDAGIVVTGTVPDIRDYLASAAVAVVPLRVGGGTRLKIYEALAMDCPMVSTTIGAEGLPLSSGIHLERADDAVSFSSAVETLLRQREYALQLGSQGGAYVRANFSWPSVARQFAEQCAAVSLRQVHR